MFLSFVSAPAVAAEPEVKTGLLPTFEARWWFSRNRLDARPVAWSLINRRSDWEYSESGTRNVLVHKPSKHEFWVGSGKGYYRLYEADCGCSTTGGRFQMFQQGLIDKAYQQWRGRVYDPAHFAAHFVR